ncbi:MAG TPA: fumarylacetoacetate hydrolase family protein [Nitrososphaera sp.]|jgi:2-keto-4-pentenoate hydratase/2-oxohepta-3-ene-1,7-dioic acid hydratase in catechol pathway
MKIARLFDSSSGETYALIGSDGRQFITRREIERELGITLPKTLEDFLFGKLGDSNYYVDKVKRGESKLTYHEGIEKFKLLPPILRTFKIVCLAFNYLDQASWLRFGKTPPKDPVIYMKARTSLIGPYEDICCPRFVTQLDYEGELALVIRDRCKDVSEDKALDHVGGYFILNDVSARDIQFIDKQYGRAKSFDTFGPCGPWLTTSDEISNPCDLHLTTKINGQVRQDSSTKNLVLSVDRIIHSLSKVMTLEPGDIISTGTPSGTVLSLSSHLKYLQHNDVVEVEIEKLGMIRNRVVFV